jgi:hypothetical protein
MPSVTCAQDKNLLKIHMNTQLLEEPTTMATGTAPALDPKLETKSGTAQSSDAQPATFAQKFKLMLHKIFEGREEYLGWHQ